MYMRHSHLLTFVALIAAALFLTIPGYSEADLFDDLTGDVVDDAMEYLDSDEDGVIDEWDNCPDTPPNSYTDKEGCTGEGMEMEGGYAYFEDNLDIYIPAIVYNDPFVGEMMLWMELAFVPSLDGELLWEFYDYGFLDDFDMGDDDMDDDDMNGDDMDDDDMNDDAKVQMGAELYAENCASCHGDDATGDFGPNIQGKDADDIEDEIENNSFMGFLDFLTSEDLDAIAAYLDSLEDDDHDDHDH